MEVPQARRVRERVVERLNRECWRVLAHRVCDLILNTTLSVMQYILGLEFPLHHRSTY